MNRIKFIQIVIQFLENCFFYPKLKKFYKSLKDVNNSVTIFDVGSNKGQSIDFFTEIYPHARIYAFEPNKKLFKKLKDKYKERNNIYIQNYGISSKEGELLFKVNAMDETSTFEELNYQSQYLDTKAKVLGVKKENLIEDKYQVEVTTLNKVFKTHKIEKVDILKVDVEGHELECLKGLFCSGNRLKPTYIQLENHNDDMYLSKNTFIDIDNLLCENGYTISTKIKHPFGDFDEVVFKLVE